MHLHVDEGVKPVVSLCDRCALHARGPPEINGVPVLSELGDRPREIELILELLVNDALLGECDLGGVVFALSINQVVEVFVRVRLLNLVVLFLGTVQV